MLQLGSQIQKLRKQRHMSLTDLARTSGVQIATLSRMENGKMTGTVASHLNIAKALNVEITELYQGLAQEPSQPIKSDSGLEAVTALNDKVSREILSRQPSTNRMLPAVIRIEGKASTPQESLGVHSERFLFVLEGTVIVKVNAQAIRLEKSASLYFNAASPHTIENPNTATAKVLCVTSPVNL